MYSRRGTYLSVGHATSRVVANLDSTALILATLYYNCNSATATAATIRSDKTSLPLVNTIKDTKEKRSNFITCASWSRKSTVLWISSKFQCAIQRLNLTHPNPVYYILNPTINKLPMNSKDGTSPGTIVHLELTIMNESKDFSEVTVHCAIFPEHFFINSAAFDPTGRYVLAITSSSVLLGFELKSRVIEYFNSIPYYVYVSSFLMFERSISSQCNRREQDRLLSHKINDNKSLEQAYEIIFTRNGDLIAINGFTEIKLYDIKALLQPQQPADAIKSRQVFSDPINKACFVFCDYSGDGEYIVGGRNNYHSDSKYELKIWNSTTGVFLDRLTGLQSIFHHLAWHPNCSLLAAATADGETVYYFVLLFFICFSFFLISKVAHLLKQKV
jgi:hypothetical protein